MRQPVRGDTAPRTIDKDQAPATVPWTKRRHHYSREDLALSLSQSLDGFGPDNYLLQPAEHVRFVVQVARQKMGTPSLQVSIPVGSAPARRRLVDHGWERVLVGRTPYFRRIFAEPSRALRAILEAYATVYGSVGDDKGWNIVSPAMRPRTPWPEPWIGEEEPVDASPDDLHPVGPGPIQPSPRWEAIGATGVTRGPRRPVRAAVMGLIALGIGGLFITSGGRVTMPLWTWPLLLAGATILGLLAQRAIARTSVPQKYAEFWGTGALGRFAVEAAFAGCAALAWGLLVSLAFGVRT